MYSDSEKFIYIDEDRMEDKVNIYLVERANGKNVYYTYSDGLVTAHEHLINPSEFQPMQPLIKLPHALGMLFLTLLNDKIEEKGINTRKVDMQAGKTELLEHRLKFSDDQLVKFIDYFTTPATVQP